MKLLKAFCLFAVIATLQSCSSSAKNDGQSTASGTSATKQTSISQKANDNLNIGDENDLIGYWVGMFNSAQELPDTTQEAYFTNHRKITIAIDQIDGGTVTGHSIVAGNERPFTGTLKNDGTTFHFLVREPGDNNYDGAFDFSISLHDSVLTGIWKAYRKIKTPERKYDLTKKVFRYDPTHQLSEDNQYVDFLRETKVAKKRPEEGYLDDSFLTTTDDVRKYNASSALLTANEVSNLKKADIFILRNSIFARHGYSFKHQQLRAYFDREPWYIPVSVDVLSQLTPIEKKNIQLLMRYEKNAKEYYANFGR